MYMIGVLVSIQTILMTYFIFQIGTIKKGKLKNSMFLVLLFVSLGVSHLFQVAWTGDVLCILIMVLFSLFYDEESFFLQWKWIVGYGSSLAIGGVVSRYLVVEWISVGIILWCMVTYLWLAVYRRLLKVSVSVGVVTIYMIYLVLVGATASTLIHSASVVAGVITFFVLEQILLGYNKSFQRKTSKFQQELLLNQYEEVKSIYLNMRGFRHDYHNHIQVIKAHLHRERMDLVEEYLLEIEQELERIDASVRSGNMMVDAILNSKMTLAEKHEIEVVCKAQVPEELGLTDIDLCVILGNLLDNAIESCQKIQDGRFIRIYMTVLKGQLYISIQNAAKEDLDFNETHYITQKRGNHGLGMKRVKLLVDKYEGYLNLQNEPGIFASEVILPLK